MKWSFQHQWTGFAQRLRNEDDNRANHLPRGPSSPDSVPAPLNTLLAAACNVLAIDYNLVKWSIIEYAGRKTKVHCDIHNLVANRDWIQLRKLLHADYAEVDLIFNETRCDVDKTSLRFIIKDEINLYFDTSRSFNQWLFWLFSAQLATYLVETQDSPAKLTRVGIKAAHITDHGQRRADNEEKKELDIPKDKNRITSTEEPRESEQISNRRMMRCQELRLTTHLATLRAQLAQPDAPSSKLNLDENLKEDAKQDSKEDWEEEWEKDLEADSEDEWVIDFPTGKCSSH